MSAPSLTSYIVKRPWLKRFMTPLANWYANAAGYRKLGLRYGDPQQLVDIATATKSIDVYDSPEAEYRTLLIASFSGPMI
jgi:ubiquinol-cytochrome c reductase subunit 7